MADSCQRDMRSDDFVNMCDLLEQQLTGKLPGALPQC